MKSSRVVATVGGLLFLAGLGAALWARREQRQTEAAQAEWAGKQAQVRLALSRSQKEAAASTQAAADLKATQARLAAGKPPAAPKAPPAPNRPPDWSALLATHPDLQAAFEKAYHANRDHLYGALYRRLNLPPDQIDRLDDLMAKDVENNFDLMGSAQAQNLPANDPTIAKLRQEQADELHQQEAAVLGPQNYTAFQTFDNEMPIRNAVGDASSMALVSGSPFTADQEEQMTQLLAQTSSAFQQNPGKKLDPSTVDWNAALAQASSFLSPAQIAVLHAESQFQPLGVLQKQFYSTQPAAPK